MKHLKIFLILWFLFDSVALSASSHLQELFREANRAYRSEKFQEALDHYNDILSQGYQSAALYFNMGNCYYRLNQIGEAVLYYEKAKKLAPRDADVQYNLELANLRVIDRVKMPSRFFLFDWWDAAKFYFSVFQLPYLVTGLFALTILVIIIRLFVKRDRIRRWVLSFAVILGILTIFWGYIFLIRMTEFSTRNRGVILTPSVTVLSAPDENSTEVFVLHEGSKVELSDQREKWVKISLPDGKTGWIASRHLGII